MSSFDLDPVESATLQENALRDSILPTDIPAGFFQGAGTGLWNGLKSGDYRVKAEQAFDDTEEQMKQRYETIKSLKPDPRTIGFLGQIGFSLGDFTSTAWDNFWSGSAVPTLLAKDVAGTYEKTGTELNVLEGMDRNTAQDVAKTEAIFQGLGVVAPAAVPGKLLMRAGSGAAIQVGMGAAERASMSYQLNQAGYPEMAAQYKVFDTAALLTDAILGGGVAAIGGSHAERPGSFRENTNPNQIDALLTMNQAAHIETGTAPGMPITPDARQAHVDAHSKAIEDLIAGNHVDVGTRVTEAEFLPHPDMDAARLEIGHAIAEHIRSIPGADQAFIDLENLKAMARDRGLEIDDPLSGNYFGADPEEIARQIEQHLSSEFGADANRLLEAGKVKIVNSVNDLPAQNVPGDVKGMHHNGVSYLVANNLSRSELRGVVLHEVGVHAGMKDMLGNDLYTKLLDTVNNSTEAAFVKARKSAEELAAKPEHVPEETLAYLVENHKDHKVVKQLIAAVRQWLYRATGGKLVNLTDADIASMAVASLRRHARQDAIAKNGADSPMFARAQKHPEQRDLMMTHNLSVSNLLHAHKMGGIPVPSLAITKKDMPLTGFGEITLMGSKDLADPKGYAKPKVYGADIYSPRYPSVTYDILPKEMRKAQADMAEAEKATGSSIDFNSIEYDGARRLENSAPLMWRFLKENGIEPNVVYKEAPKIDREFEPFVNDKRDAYDLAKDPEFQKAVEDFFNRIDKGDRFNKDNPNWANIIIRQAHSVESYRRNLADTGKPDQYATRDALRKQVDENKLGSAFESYGQKFVDSMNPKERIFKGYTDNGRKYIDHNLENVVKIMKNDLVGGEGNGNLNGLGAVRAKYTPQFKSIAEIKKNKDRLLTAEDFDNLKTELETDYEELMHTLSEAHSAGDSFRFADTVGSSMKDAATMGIDRALKENGFDMSKVTPEMKQQMADFMLKLRNMPTEYFEANILRAVDIGEFSGAVVPSDAPPEVMQILKDKGITDIKTYRAGDEADRKAQIGSFDDLYFSRKQQAEGKNVPDSVDAAAHIESAVSFAGSKQFPTNRDFKIELQDRVNTAAKSARVDIADFSKKTEEYLHRIAVSEGMSAMLTNANAVGWYNEKVTKALNLVSLIHPEIATNHEDKFAFVWSLAVTSNGLKVDKNFELAEEAYNRWKSSSPDYAKRRMPTNVGIGTASAAINNTLKLYNTLIEKHGFEAVEKFMTTLQKAGDVEKFTGQKISGENLTTMVYGAAALGPKIGNGFFMNLYGKFEQLTMDRWLMRTWGRWTGTLVNVNETQVKSKREQIKKLIKALDPAQKKELEGIIKAKLKIGTNQDIDDAAVAIWKSSTKPQNRQAMSSVALGDEAGLSKLDEILGAPKKGVVRVSIGDELRKSGNALAKYLDGQKEAPSGPPERGNIRKVFSSALEELQKEHPALTMSDFQALLWYPEKRLYDAAKTKEEVSSGYEDEDAPDYANAAAKLAKSRGVSDQSITDTISRVDAELQANVGSGRVRPGERGSENSGRASGETQAENKYSAKSIVSQRPDMDIASSSGDPINAARAIEIADANIETAKAESKSFEIAVACGLRG